jgi:hypothetical protein
VDAVFENGTDLSGVFFHLFDWANGNIVESRVRITTRNSIIIIVELILGNEKSFREGLAWGFFKW